MKNEEKKAIYKALICILDGMKITNLIAYDEEFKNIRNKYIDSTIKLLENLERK